MMKILIADDEAVITNLVRRVCEKNGMAVTTVNNGLDAEKELLTNEYDVCILDYSMPKKNGDEVLRAVHEKTRTPIIMLSAYDKPELFDIIRNDIRFYLRKGDLNIDTLSQFVKTIAMIGKY